MLAVKSINYDTDKKKNNNKKTKLAYTWIIMHEILDIRSSKSTKGLSFR